jgi:hypothetical protein
VPVRNRSDSREGEHLDAGPAGPFNGASGAATSRERPRRSIG